MSFDFPPHWRRSRLRFLLRRSPSDEQKRQLTAASRVSFAAMEAIGQDGKIDLTLTKDKEEVSSGYTLFSDGDVLVAKITPCFENGKGALVRGTLNGVGFGTTELHVLSPTAELDSRFLYYVTASPHFRRQGELEMVGAAGQKRVPVGFIEDYVLAIPQRTEQETIAIYLDYETAQIDALVAAKERMLEILAEKRQALIAHAVTRGLTPDAPTRDSGVSWLGEVPTHWTVRRTATLFCERDDRGEPHLPLMNVSINTGVTEREFADDRIERVAEDYNTYKVARRGDIAFNKMRMWQGAVGVAPVDGLVSPDYTVARPVVDVDIDYFGTLFRCPIMSAEFARRSHGIVWDRLRLYWEGFRDVRVPLPPLQEQHAIVEYVRSETRKLDALRTATERTIGLLRERRSSLIAEAVTGKLHVPDTNGERT